MNEARSCQMGEAGQKPLKPAGHVQVNELTPSVHTPPLRHGELAHLQKSMSASSPHQIREAREAN
jgi:hypothetical protein